MAEKSVKPLITRVDNLLGRTGIQLRSVKALRDFAQKNYLKSKNPYVRAVIYLADDIISQKSMTAEHKKLLRLVVSRYNNPFARTKPLFTGKTFVISGTFNPQASRKECETKIKRKRGKVRTKVTSKTDYVVVAEKVIASGERTVHMDDALFLTLTGQASIGLISERTLKSSLANRRSTKPKKKRKTQKKPVLSEPEVEQADIVSVETSDVVATIEDDSLTEGQKLAFDVINSGENVYLTGLGGTGKSYLLNRLIEHMSEQGKQVIVCAPTGIAAINVGGSTIHRTLDIKPADTLKLRPRIILAENSPLIMCDMVIVDEISMCRMDLFDHLSKSLKKANQVRREYKLPKIQLVVVGDFCQLPPVVKREDRTVLNKRYRFDVGNAYPFLTAEWKSWNFQTVELVEAIRQRDAEFVEVLNLCRLGNLDGLHWIVEHAASERPEAPVVLCGRNIDAQKENEFSVRHVDGFEKTYVGKTKGRIDAGDMATERNLRLKVGSRVMSLANQSERTYMNGSLGTVLYLGEKDVTVEFDNGCISKIGYQTWDITKPSVNSGRVAMSRVGQFTQIPLKLAYAMTIHKAQGQTFDQVAIYPDCWDPGQLYTAMSRCRTIEGLYFEEPPDDKALVVSPQVLKFYGFGGMVG